MHQRPSGSQFNYLLPPNNCDSTCLAKREIPFSSSSDNGSCSLCHRRTIDTANNGTAPSRKRQPPSHADSYPTPASPSSTSSTHMRNALRPYCLAKTRFPFTVIDARNIYGIFCSFYFDCKHLKPEHMRLLDNVRYNSIWSAIYVSHGAPSMYSGSPSIHHSLSLTPFLICSCPLLFSGQRPQFFDPGAQIQTFRRLKNISTAPYDS